MIDAKARYGFLRQGAEWAKPLAQCGSLQGANDNLVKSGSLVDVWNGDKWVPRTVLAVGHDGVIVDEPLAPIDGRANDSYAGVYKPWTAAGRTIQSRNILRRPDRCADSCPRAHATRWH